MSRVTADSNIYISALRFGGKPLTILELALDREIELSISEAILHETRRVLRDKFHYTPDDLHEVEMFISAITTHVYPTERLDAVPSDRDDNRVLECAVKAGADVIVTGDRDLLRLGNFRGIRVVKASDFLAERQSRTR